jgi:hypothetical protein
MVLFSRRAPCSKSAAVLIGWIGARCNRIGHDPRSLPQTPCLTRAKLDAKDRIAAAVLSATSEGRGVFVHVCIIIRRNLSAAICQE